MEQVKLASYEKLEEENRELKTVLRKLSHEMGNALTLLGASIFYVETDIAAANGKCDVSDLKNDYTYICNLFKELREYNHTESLAKKEVTVGELVSSIESAFSKMAGNEKVFLVTHRQDNAGNKKIYADLLKLRQALINILKNCIDAIEENEDNKGKRIDVSVLIEPITIDATMDKSRNQTKEMVHIEIRDNGKGICEAHISEIFQPMFTYGKKDGTGLGLSVVRKIVEDHKGKIEAVSVLGTGTAIHIYLPILK